MVKFIIFIFLIAANVAFAEEPSNPPVAHDADDNGGKQEAPTQNTETQPDDTQATPQGVVSEQGTTTPNARKANQESDESENERMWPPSAGWATVYVTILYALISFAQWRAIQQQGKAIIDSERPWLMVTINDPHSPEKWPRRGDENFLFQIKWTITNVGRSPAFSTKMYFAMITADFPIQEDKLPPYKDPLPYGTIVLPPNGTYQHPLEKGAILTQPTIDDIVGGHNCVIFYGFIKYGDIFRKPHKTRFCSYWHQEREVVTFYPTGPPSWVEYT